MSRLPRLLPLIAIAIGGVVAVRAVGAAPGFLSGAKAWAEEAAPGATPASASAPAVAPAVCALTPEQLAQQAGLSPAELRVIQSLKSRRVALDARDTDFASMLPLLATAEEKLDAKVKAMEAIKAEVAAMLGQVDAKEQAEIDRLVQVYSAMRPRDAAPIMATLNDAVRLPVAAAMRPRSLAAVMAQMPPAAARELTEKLAHRFEAQQLAARAAAAGSNTPAATTPAPVETAAAAPATPPTAELASQPATAAPTPTRTANRAPARTPTRAASRPARRAATPPAPAARPTETAAGPRPYQPGPAATPATTADAPRQTVQ